MSKPKQKSVTMWTIWSPYTERVCLWCASTARHAWALFTLNCNSQRKELYKEGYRAVKGKFVWEDK